MFKLAQSFKSEILLNNLMPIPSEVSDYISSLPMKVSPAVGITRKLIDQKLMRSIGTVSRNFKVMNLLFPNRPCQEDIGDFSPIPFSQKARM